MKNNEKTRKKKNQDGPIVIELNLSLTVGIIGAIIAIIVAITTVKVITTMFQANGSKNAGNENDINQHVIYVTSTTKDESGNIVEDKDSNGNVIKIPVPKGYTASQIDGETSLNKGFVIYEGDVDWNTILLNTSMQSTNSSNTKPVNTNTESTQSSKTQPTNSEETQNTETQSTTTQSTNTETKSTTNDMPNDEEQTEENTIIDNVQNTQSTMNTKTSSTEVINNKTLNTEKTSQTLKTENEENKNENQNNITTSTKQEEKQDNQATKSTVEDSSTSNPVTSSTANNTTESTNPKQNENKENNIQENPKETIVENSTENGIDGANAVDLEDETADDTGTTDSGETTLTPEEQQAKNIFNLQKERNQYVWVPVSDISQIYGVDSNKKLWGKLYNFSSSGRSNRNWTETNGIMSITNATNYREPDVVWGTGSYAYDTDGYSYMHNNGLGQTRYEMLAQELEQNYLEIMESIKKYGGFYIGRYELGYENNQAVVRKMNTNNNNITWYTSYKRCLTLKGSNDNIKTMMITGSLWDETLEWLVRSGATNSEGTALTYQLVGSNSTTFGNYYNATFSYIAKDAEQPVETETKETSKGVLIPTGSAEYAKTNNIYDMAGNVLEWTTEAYSANGRVERGGYCNNYGYNYPLAYRYVNIPVSYYSSLRLQRLTLYKIGYPETLYPDTAPRRVTN